MKFYLCLLMFFSFLVIPTLLVAEIEYEELDIGYDVTIPMGISDNGIVVGSGYKDPPVPASVFNYSFEANYFSYAAGTRSYLFWYDTKNEKLDELYVGDSLVVTGIDSNGKNAFGFNRESGPTTGFIYNPRDGKTDFKYDGSLYDHTFIMDGNASESMIGYLGLPLVEGLPIEQAFYKKKNGDFVLWEHPDSLGSTRFVSLNNNGIAIGVVDQGRYFIEYNINTDTYGPIFVPEVRSSYSSFYRESSNIIVGANGESVENNDIDMLSYSTESSGVVSGVVYDKSTGDNITIFNDAYSEQDQYLSDLSNNGTFSGIRWSPEGRVGFIAKDYDDADIDYIYYDTYAYCYQDYYGHMYVSGPSIMLDGIYDVNRIDGKLINVKTTIEISGLYQDGKILRATTQEELHIDDYWYRGFYID